MRSQAFDELFAMLSAVRFSPADLVRLCDWIASLAHPAECLALIETTARSRPCPRCGCGRVHRGQASGLQRFRCLGCGRSYNALTGTPLARLCKKGCWLPYLQCVLESRTVRDAARVVGMHRTTGFRWRHRFVPGAMRDRPVTLSAIVEADGTYRLEQPFLRQSA
jgi:transposase-like protein